MKRKIFSWSLAMVISLLFHGVGIGYAKVTGVCSDCHTMHNSQNGDTWPDNTSEPNDYLLIGGCVGCHTGENNPGTTIPYVLSPAMPGLDTNVLAGGNFYWVSKGDDAKGHNVYGVIPGEGQKDEALDTAPGLGTTCEGSCHETLAVKQTVIPEYGSGCQGCHLNVMHHANDGTGTKYVNSSPWYRFLSGHEENTGVEGLEDSDWQLSEDLIDHNEYLGFVGNKSKIAGFAELGNTMTGFCCGCHGQFHVQDTTDTGASPWLRHPSDAVIPNTGEYAVLSDASYDPDIPVARNAADMATIASTNTPSSSINPGRDMVMCLSCHYAHGSPYDDMLRWDYATMKAGGGSSVDGCFFCHTTKDN